eukprot:scaffold179817_cov22-Tisochrysis_lutea.AAC.1
MDDIAAHISLFTQQAVNSFQAPDLDCAPCRLSTLIGASVRDRHAHRPGWTPRHLRLLTCTPSTPSVYTQYFPVRTDTDYSLAEMLTPKMQNWSASKVEASCSLMQKTPF